MKQTHFLIRADDYAKLEALITDSYGDDQTVLDNTIPVDLSEGDLKKKSHAFDPYLLYHLGFDYKTSPEVIYHAGYLQCAKDILNTKQ